MFILLFILSIFMMQLLKHVLKNYIEYIEKKTALPPSVYLFIAYLILLFVFIYFHALFYISFFILFHFLFFIYFTFCFLFISHFVFYLFHILFFIYFRNLITFLLFLIFFVILAMRIEPRNYFFSYFINRGR